MNRKKILILSGGGLDRLAESFQLAFESLGHTAEIYFEDRNSASLNYFKFFSRTPFTHLCLKYWEKHKEKNNGIQAGYDIYVQLQFDLCPPV